MIILEYEAKQLLNRAGIPIPFGAWIDAPQGAYAVAELYETPVVLKVQIPQGGRLKAGGIRFVETPAEAEIAAGELLGTKIGKYTIDRLLLEQKLPFQTELFLGVTYDDQEKCITLVGSVEGGIEVESTKQLLCQPISMCAPFQEYMGREFAAKLGTSGQDLVKLGQVITKLVDCFLQWDALLLEINPLVLTSARNWLAVDVHLEIDDDALFRQKELLASVPYSLEVANRRSSFEQQALELDHADHRGVAGRLIEFDGEIGLLIGGGGASLTIMDALLDAGLKPANYCEIGGNPSVWKIKELTKLILSQPQVKKLVVMMNVVSNTRVDLVARGVIKGILEMGLEPHQVIAAFRIPGSWEEEGQALLRHYQVSHFGRETSIDQVVEAIRGNSG